MSISSKNIRETFSQDSTRTQLPRTMEQVIREAQNAYRLEHGLISLEEYEANQTKTYSMYTRFKIWLFRKL